VSELKTARVPEAFEAEFIRAEELVSKYFGERLHAPSRGTIEVAGERYVLVRAASLSVEFFDLVYNLYGTGRELEAREFARNMMFDLAHAIGKSDANNFHARMKPKDPMEHLSAGPIHFAYTGWAFVDIDGKSQPVPGPGYLLIYDHPYSFEADAWQRAERLADVPVCIMNAGYSSGWCEESFGLPLVASEVLCRAKGDDCCRFVMAPPDEIEQRVQEYIAGEPGLSIRGYEIPDFFARKSIEEELREARDELEQRVIERTADLRLANEKLRLEMEERERIGKRLQNTQRLESLGRLAGGVAHDFNNLLGVIMGYSSILEGQVPRDDPKHTMLSEITEAAQHAAHLTRQLLMFSRAQVLADRRVDLNEVVEQVITMLRRMVGDDVVITHELTAHPATVMADVGQLEQMLMNLAVNARDAMPNGGQLRMNTQSVPDDDEPTHVRLTVSDTGAGMDEETQSKIFEPFFSTKEDGEGTGLGLSTVYGIVTQFGGTVTVQSAPAQGARFDIVLPIAEEPTSIRGAALTEHNEKPLESPGEGTSQRTALLVEEQVGFRALMASLLGDLGYAVLVANDGGDALRIAQRHPHDIDVLVTDSTMPGMSARELVRRMLGVQPDVRVLLMSGAVDEREEPDSTNQVFISKPFTPEQFESALLELTRGC